MSSSILINAHSLPRNESSVVTALGEVALAFKHLAAALVNAATSTPTPQLTAYQEAEQLRTYAAQIQAQDPNFAQDLFAAANRHEMAAAAVNVR